LPTFINTKGMNRIEWRKIRKNYLGASEIAAAVGLNPYRSQLDLWRDKTGDPTFSEFKGNTYTKWGNRLESAIAWGFAKDFKLKIKQDHKLRIHDNKILSCSLDRLVLDGRKKGILEIKNMGDKAFSKLVMDISDVSMMYYSQIQQQFSVSELTWGYFIILVGGNTLVVRKVKPDKKFIKLQDELGMMFWNEHILTKKEPEYNLIYQNKYKALKIMCRESEDWKKFRFTPDLAEDEEKDPLKIFIRKIESSKNKTELNKLIETQDSVIVKMNRDNKSLITTIVKLKHIQLRK